MQRQDTWIELVGMIQQVTDHHGLTGGQQATPALK